MVVIAAPKSAAEYAADARRSDVLRADAESAGDGLAADRHERRATLARKAVEGARFLALGGAR